MILLQYVISYEKVVKVLETFKEKTEKINKLTCMIIVFFNHKKKPHEKNISSENLRFFRAWQKNRLLKPKEKLIFSLSCIYVIS